MFGRKKDENDDAVPEDEEKPDADSALPLRSKARFAGTTPASAPAPVTRPEIVRRAPDIHGGPQRRSDRGAMDSDGKKLIVGREIILSGEINSCDKLVVEGHVEASINDCREIEIAESGMFKGAADIELAEISGTFDGELTARQLLIVRATGRISGTVRFGQLEIERGGEIVGDVQVWTPGAATGPTQPDAPEPEPEEVNASAVEEAAPAE